MIEKLNKWFPIVNTIAIIVIAFALVGGNDRLGASGTRFPNGLSADSTSPSAGEVRGTTATFTSTGNFTGAMTFGSTGSFAGLITLNAGQLRSYSVASSSVTTGTMRESDLLNYDTLLYTPSGAAATKTLTLPATSTLTNMIPTAGDMQETCIYNATTTVASSITLASGSGIDFERVATSTVSGITGVLAIPGQGSACLKFIRQTNTDISVLMTSFIDAD